MKIIHFDLFFKEEKELLVDLEMYLKDPARDDHIIRHDVWTTQNTQIRLLLSIYVFTTAAYEKGQVRVLLLIEFHQRSTPVGLLSKHVHYALSDCSSIACKIQKCKQKLDLYSY